MGPPWGCVLTPTCLQHAPSGEDSWTPLLLVLGHGTPRGRGPSGTRDPQDTGDPVGQGTLWDMGPAGTGDPLGRGPSGTGDPLGHRTRWDRGPAGMGDPLGHGTRWDTGPSGTQGTLWDRRPSGTRDPLGHGTRWDGDLRPGLPSPQSFAMFLHSWCSYILTAKDASCT